MAAAPYELPPLALYIHFPWCVRKCPYCDFNSHPLDGALPEEAYVEALLADLRFALPGLGGRKPVSLFLGGGTPSLFSVTAIGRLLEAIDRLLPWQADAEISMEANPGTISVADFAALRSSGINRLSLGIQSFDPAALRALKRIHGAQEACRAAELAGRHFDNFNLDLMYGLPGQTLELARSDLERALSFGPSHLSCYQLILEAGTCFGDRPPANLPEDESCADMQEAVEARLAEAGFIHYETSAFARPYRQCRHNLNYWQFGDYLGIGAGAHSKLTDMVEGVVRQERSDVPSDYLRLAFGKTQGLVSEWGVSSAELPFEFMMNALRLQQGFPSALFEQTTRMSLRYIEPGLEKAVKAGFLLVSGGRIVPTLQGRRFLNRLLEFWLPDVAKMTP